MRGIPSGLAQTLEQLPLGIILAETSSGRIVFVNGLGRRILEQPAGAADLDDDEGMLDGFTLDGKPVAATGWPLARAACDGEVIAGENLAYTARSGRQGILRLSAGPIYGESGKSVAGVVVFQDVSEQVRTEQLLAGQRDILALIAGGAPLAQILSALVVSIEALSEYPARASILLASADGAHLEHGAAPSLPSAYNEAIDGIEIGPSMGSCGTAAHRRETVIVSDTMSDPLWSDFRELAAEHGLRACWSTPVLADDGELVGTMALYYDEPRSPSGEDRRVIELLTRTAGVAIARARDAQARAVALAELQTSLLPRALPAVPRVDAAVMLRPGDRTLDVGGDFYDLFALPDSSWGFVMGDVRGHGAQAAAVTALTRYTTRAIGRLEPDPGGVLAFVSEALRDSDYDRSCTAVYGRLEPAPDALRIRLACGGHPSPLVKRAGGAVETIELHGPMLGVFDAPEFPAVGVELGPGDTLVLYTDGLVERNPRVQGDNLLALVRDLSAGTAREMIAQLTGAALGDGAQLIDDVAVLMLQMSAAA